MIIKRKTWKDHAWCALSFPRANRTIIWNDTLKTYDIYKGTINGIEPERKSLKPKKIQTITTYIVSPTIASYNLGKKSCIIFY